MFPDELPIGYNRVDRFDRAMRELTGFLRGIVADGVVNVAEAESLSAWILRNEECSSEWPICELTERIARIYADGIIEQDELDDLRDLSNRILGTDNPTLLDDVPTDLPLCRPVPEVVFDQNEFVFTGTFYYGTRRICHEHTERAGAVCHSSPRMSTRYLVIGSIATRDWKFSSFGRKILRAVELQPLCGLHIISERTWSKALTGR